MPDAVNTADVERLARRYYDRLFRTALFMCNDPESAEDLVQETFVAAARAIERFEGRSTPYTWLYGIFINKFRSWLRDKKKKQHLPLQRRGERDNGPGAEDWLEAGTPETDEIMQKKEQAEAVRAAMDELPPHHRDALVLRYVEGLSYDQISGALDCSVGTVKSRLHYALKKVGEKLRNDPAV